MVDCPKAAQPSQRCETTLAVAFRDCSVGGSVCLKVGCRACTGPAPRPIQVTVESSGRGFGLVARI